MSIRHSGVLKSTYFYYYYYKQQSEINIISDRKRVINIQVTHDVTNLSRSDMEDSDPPLNKAFEGNTYLHAADAFTTNVDNIPAIVSCVGRVCLSP